MNRVIINANELYLNSSMSTTIRHQRLNALTSIANSNALSLSKKQILNVLLSYARNNLYSNSIFNLTSPDRYNTYNSIIQSLHLPDLLFVHHVSRLVRNIRELNSSLRDNLSPIVRQCDRALRRQHINDTRAMFLGFVFLIFLIKPRAAFALLAFFLVTEYMLPSSYQLSELFVERRIHDSYENLLAMPYQQQGEQAVLYDGLDDTVARVANIGRRASSMLLSRIINRGERLLRQEEQKESANIRPRVNQ